MKKVAVFGNAGGGKSTLSRRLADITGLPLYIIDIIQFPNGMFSPGEINGGKVSPEAYLKLHTEIIGRERWIIDGYGGTSSAWERFAAADTLVYVDLPIMSHYWGVTTRFAKGLFKNPTGWPENSPIWESTWEGYRVIRLCHRHLTPKYRHLVDEMATTKRVHHLRSRREVHAFVSAVIDEHRPGTPGNGPV
jgi:adenylate kinase family enzyme